MFLTDDFYRCYSLMNETKTTLNLFIENVLKKLLTDNNITS